MGLTIGTSVTNIHICHKYRYVVDTIEIIHPVVVGDIALATQQVKGRGVKFVQMILGEGRHTRHAATATNDAAIANNCGGHPRIRSYLKCLQATTGHATDCNLGHIHLVVKGTRRITVLRNSPVYRVQQLRGSRSAATTFTLLRHWADGNHQEAMGSHFREEVDMLPGGV